MTGVRVHLGVDPPQLSLLVDVLRIALAGAEVALDPDLVTDARALLDELDEVARSGHEDELDGLGPPREGGGRVTIETDDYARRMAILQAADLMRYLRADAGERVTRLRVVMDLAPIVRRPGEGDE